jgi:hypothetical protein
MTFTAGPGTVRLIGASAQGNPTLPISATWNNAATTFTGIRFDVTDTASAAGSLLMDLRVGGVSRLSVSKGGLSTASFGFLGNTGIWIGPSTALAGLEYYGGSIIFKSGSNFPFYLGNNFEVHLPANGFLGWTSQNGNPYGTAADLSLFRDAADTLAQRRAGNPQIFRLYNTFTDVLNYERFAIRWQGNVINLLVENAGSGSARPMSIGTGGFANLSLVTNDVIRWFVDTGGHFLASLDNSYDIGAAAATRPRNLFLGSYVQLSEMTAPAAPAANSVRIYAVDNGSGKTQLMALFATGAAQQIAIEP